VIREVDVIRALQRADPRAVACGLSAARLWKLPLPLDLSVWDRHDLDSRIHMNLTGVHRLRSAQVAWRSCDLSPSDRARQRGIVTTTRLRTFLDLADVVPRDDLVAIGDHLVRRPRPSVEGRTRPYVEISALADAVSRYRGRGARRLRSAMTDVRVGADSAPETALRLALLRAGLPVPLLNTTVHESGQWLGDPDMAWTQWKVCVEYDGRHHRTRAQQAKDIRRGERRRLAGWTELVVAAEDMKDDAAQAVDRVRSELRRRGWEG
jgi:very-short-patch-repair endonuclease